MRTRPTPADPVTLVDVLGELRALGAKVDALAARFPPGPRDQADVRLLTRIAATAGGLAFTAAALFRRRAAGDVTLAEALAACDVTSPKQLGKLLRRLEGRDVGGVVLERLDVGREGVVWRARVA